MHSVADVISLIDASAAALPPEAIPLADALGTVLGRTVFADADQPAFDRSAIDGFAVPSGSAPGEYRLGDEILPGNPAPDSPKPGEALRIFTGAAVPEGCGLVMIEDAVAAANRPGSVTLNKAPDESLIRGRGSSIKAGTALLRPGAEIGPGEIALLASLGEARPFVHPLPRILHLITGRELLPPDARLEPGRIRDSNGPMIRALLAEAGFPSVSQIRIDESVDALVGAAEGAGPFDLLLVSGGASVGKYDRTRSGLEALGFSLLVERVNSRPGKPMILGRRGDQWAFGLPGNPVAHFVVFHVFVKRLLRALAKKSPVECLNARLNADTPASSDPRETFWPARLTQADTTVEATPMRWVDSGDLAALRGINALIHFPESTRAAAGDRVSVVPCRRFPVCETRLDPRGGGGV